MGMPTERWKLIGVHIQSVLWDCPFFDPQRNILLIYSIDCCCIHFESGCACFWRNMGVRSAFTLFIKHLFCSQYLIELYLEFIGFLGLLLFSPIYSWLFKCICKGCEEFFLLGIICIYSAVVIVAQVTHSYTGKVFSIIVHVLHCILFSIHLYNKNAWFAFLLSICLVPASYKNILFVILAIKNCREHISFFSGCFAF